MLPDAEHLSYVDDGRTTTLIPFNLWNIVIMIDPIIAFNIINII